MALGTAIEQVHVSEVFSPPRCIAVASRFGLNPGLAFDLRTGRDLNDRDHLAELWDYLATERPLLVVGSPECTAFSNLQYLNRGTEA